VSSCGNHEKGDPESAKNAASAASDKTSSQGLSDNSGLVTIPADSPQLNRIRTAIVEAASVPVEELVAPGKVEMNPNRLSRIMMPLAGRVREVLVQLGVAVGKGQPLVSVDSPDAGAAQSAYRQAE